MNAIIDLSAETGRCVACGLCLPHCPTYRKTLSEADSPRGRIMLTQGVVQGVLPINEKYMAHLDLCLTCRSCERVCPNHVQYGVIADAARRLIRQQRPASLSQRAAEYLVASPKLLKLAGFVLRLTTLLGLHGLAPSVFPRTPKQRRWQASYPAPSARGEVCLFLGCASNIFETDVLAASIFVLNRLGYTVHIPHNQTCCGGLNQQAGDNAADLNTRNLQAFAEFADLPVLCIASGCGARLLDLMPERFQDINAFLKDADWQGVTLQALPAKVAVQDPCSLRNILRAETAPYQLLKRIPRLEVVSLPGNTQCCGGAGSYMLTQPEMAVRLRDDKIAAIDNVQPDYVATANIGCALHIARGTRARIVHPVTLLAGQMGYKG
ncbi:MAG TPA: (Fe-S)-binding protein [Methylophilaceae bacterium]